MYGLIESFDASLYFSTFRIFALSLIFGEKPRNDITYKLHVKIEYLMCQMIPCIIFVTNHSSHSFSFVSTNKSLWRLPFPSDPYSSMLARRDKNILSWFKESNVSSVYYLILYHWVYRILTFSSRGKANSIISVNDIQIVFSAY